MKKYNFVYKTTFNDGRYYIGQHKTDNLDDRYFGSNDKVKYLVKHHPELEPKRIILEFCKTQIELNERERYYIGDLYKNDPLCLNGNNICTISEFGHPHSLKGVQSPSYGKHHTEESKKQISEAHKGKHHTEETRKKMSEAHKGKHHTEESKKQISESNKGKRYTEESKKQMSESAKKRYKNPNERKKQSEKMKNRKCLTDGIDRIYVEPEYWGEFLDIGFWFVNEKHHKLLY